MPDPDPHPPQPRPVSAARWLLMLVPSVPMIVSPFIQDAQIRLRGQTDSEDRIGTSIVVFFLTLCASAVLSLIMGFLLEKWRHSVIESFSRAILYGLLIFFTDCFVAFTGCTVGAAIPHP